MGEDIRIDLGCGKNKKEGFIGVDVIAFDGVDQVVDLSKTWPWEDGSVDEVNCSHMIEHLDADQRIFFVNELHRVLKTGGKCSIIVPHWASCRAYGDLSHKWPPVVEFWFYYLNKEWREINAPHNTAYTCDFDATWGYSMRQDLMIRNQEYQMFALNNYKEAAQDIMATVTKK
jgi:SAM-dependent methyltransferase